MAQAHLVALGDHPPPPTESDPPEKMKKMTCVLCPEDLECSVLYFAEKDNIVAHESCLLYSSGLVEYDDHDTSNCDRNFDLESVKKEIKRGNKLKCKFCGKKGATVGCDVKACTKNYHFFCAKGALASVHTDADGTYKVFCRQHTESMIDTTIGPNKDIVKSFDFCDHYFSSKRMSEFSVDEIGLKRKRGRKKHLSTDIKQTEAMPFTGLERQLKEERGKHPEAIMKADFLKKCKEAGLLNDLIEELLDKLVFIQERLMDDVTSEEDYEEIGTSLFDCRLFEDTFVKFQRAIENKIDQYEKQQQQLKKEIKLLQDLKQILSSSRKQRPQVKPRQL